jgi:hypothetical protein
LNIAPCGFCCHFCLRVVSLDRNKDFLKTSFAKLYSGQCTGLLFATSQAQTVKNTQHYIYIINYLCHIQLQDHPLSIEMLSGLDSV